MGILHCPYIFDKYVPKLKTSLKRKIELQINIIIVGTRYIIRRSTGYLAEGGTVWESIQMQRGAIERLLEDIKWK